MKKAVLIVLTLAMLLTVAACGKKGEKDPNAVLTDSNVPLEVGAEIWEFGSEEQTQEAPINATMIDPIPLEEAVTIAAQ